jgi:hypothetical protein
MSHNPLPMRAWIWVNGGCTRRWNVRNPIYVTRTVRLNVGPFTRHRPSPAPSDRTVAGTLYTWSVLVDDGKSGDRSPWTRLGRSLDNVLLAHASYDNERFRFTSLSLLMNGCLGTLFWFTRSTQLFFSQISYLPR